MRRALAIDEMSYGPDHPDVALSLKNLAALLQATKRPTEAEPLMRRALAIAEKIYGPDDPRTTRYRGNMNIVMNLLDGSRGRIASSSRKLASEKIGRNEPCPCNSGKKYKKCCGT
jgi:uncharacterized protein YecA (UPF0149 family)